MHFSFILLFEKAQMEESHKVVISIKIPRGAFGYYLFETAGREHPRPSGSGATENKFEKR